jgi:hypothetical protein
MGTVFILLVVAYIFSFLFNINTKDINNTLVGFLNLSENIIVKSINYFKNHQRQGLILGSALIHILGFYLINQNLTFKVPVVVKQDWRYLASADIESQEQKEFNTNQELEHPDSPDEEPLQGEQSADNDTKMGKEGLDLPSDTTDMPNLSQLAYQPIVNSPTPVNPAKFVSNKNSTSIKTGKNLFAGNTDDGGAGRFGFGKNNGSSFKSGEILGNRIEARKLGVILDVSHSMSPYREKLEKQIRANFPNSLICYVDGCAIGTLSQATSAFQSLASSGVDAIYWFSDLQDPESLEGLTAVEQAIKGKSIKLYVRSVDKSPNPKLESIINSSNGSCFVGLN